MQQESQIFVARRVQAPRVTDLSSTKFRLKRWLLPRLARTSRLRLSAWTVGGRSLPDVVSSLTAFSESGVRFRSLTEAGVALDGSPSSLLVISVLAAAASYERTLMMHRVAEAKKAKGKAAQGGRPRLLTDKQVARARSLIQDEGLSTSAAASRVGVSRRTLHRYLAA